MSLHLIIGPMFAGKTSRLISLYHQLTHTDQTICVINHVSDTSRYHSERLTSHDNVTIACHNLSQLGELSNTSELFKKTSIFLINEGQFFVDIVSWVKDAVNHHNKIIYIAGLESDFKGNPFGTWLNLISHCDTIEKLHATCDLCKRKDAIYSGRKTSDTEQIMVGGVEIYRPLCRECFYLERR